MTPSPLMLVGMRFCASVINRIRFYRHADGENAVPTTARLCRSVICAIKRARPVLPLLMLCVVLATLAQDAPINVPTGDGSGGGVLIEGNPLDERDSKMFNPLYCQSYTCQRLRSLLYPRLLGIDPQTAGFAPNAPNGVAAAWSIDLQTAEMTTVYQFTIRDDLTWSDGTPISANDVYFSFLAARESGTNFAAGLAKVREAAPVGADAVRVSIDGLTCDLLTNLNIPILPAHVFMPNFPQVLREGQSFRFVEFAEESRQPTVTAGAFRLRANRSVYNELASAHQVYADAGRALVDGFELVTTDGSDDAVNRFINGETNFIVNPPYDRWQDVLAIPNVQPYIFPAPEFDYLAFNVANPREPRPFDHPEGQGNHPVFGDARVIQAIRLALDVEEMMQIAVSGYGQRVAINQAPLSPVYDESLTPPPYDFRAAERLLDEAGWKDTNGDGIRECITCLYARYRSDLRFTLVVDEGAERNSLNAFVIQNQLRRVGFDVSLDSVSDSVSLQSTIRRQTYDAYLTTWQQTYPYPSDGGWSSIFSAEQDLTGKETANFAPIYGMNNTSYVNPVLDEKLYAALTVPQCDPETRAALYKDPELQQILMQEVPFIWLYAPLRLYAAGGEVQGFAPVAGYPLATVESWRVSP